MAGPGTAEAGRTADSLVVHAVRPGLQGPTAVCGAGRVVVRVAGRFDPEGPDACAACADAA